MTCPKPTLKEKKTKIRNCSQNNLTPKTKYTEKTSEIVESVKLILQNGTKGELTQS